MPNIIASVTLAACLLGAAVALPIVAHLDHGQKTWTVATECRDGSESGSTGRGTCSHHGGEEHRS